MNKHGLYDIVGTVHVPFWQTNVFYGTVIAVIVCAAALFIAYMIKRYRNRAIVLSIDEQAKQELQLLQKNGLVNAQKGKEFYLRLTEIIKNYLHGRYGIESHGKTDQELLEVVKTLGFDEQILNDLQSIFSGMTVIKFANMHGAQAQLEQDWQRSLSFVQKTAPRKS